MTTPSRLEDNLRCLGTSQADLADRIRQARPTPLVWTPARSETAETAVHDGRPLGSRHAPRAAAARLVDGVDLDQYAAVVVAGFGLGYHVEALAARMRGTGLIIVFEPDLGLLRAVLERLDHAKWLASSPVVIIDDPHDRAAISRVLRGAEALLGQGVATVDDPAGRTRLADALPALRASIRAHLATARTTLVSTLLRATDTAGNLLGNAVAYAGAAGLADLRGAARGRPAVVVAAGPSLGRHLDALRETKLAERCVIVAVQTVLRPLLAAGIRPHFVTALDYHPISRRFYEGIDADDVRGTVLVADPKVHPSVPAAFPGAVRFCRSDLLEGVFERGLGDADRLPAGSTVAHLAVALARHLGADPIALIGLDLAFPDGLYYAHAAAIHDEWAPELGPLRPLVTMEWTRIARHRAHLTTAPGVDGLPVWTDAQMLAYRAELERDLTDLDGTAQVLHIEPRGLPLAGVPTADFDAVVAAARSRTPWTPPATPPQDEARVAATMTRAAELRSALQRMHAVFADAAECHRVAARGDATGSSAGATDLDAAWSAASTAARTERAAFRLITQTNQLGTFRRLRRERLAVLHDHDVDAATASAADRAEHLHWVAETARAVAAHLPVPREEEACADSITSDTVPALPAFIPVESNACIVSGALEATLRRLADASYVGEVVLVVPPGVDVESVRSAAAAWRPIAVHRLRDAPDPAPRDAVRNLRRWSPVAWRGPAGLTPHDEILDAEAILGAMRTAGHAAGVLVGPTWFLVDPHITDALIRAHRAEPDAAPLRLAAAPPGLAPIVLTEAFLATRTTPARSATVGAYLDYDPDVAGPDPVASAAHVDVAYRLRRAFINAIPDSARNRAILAGTGGAHGPALARLLAAATAGQAGLGPRHLVVRPGARDGLDDIVGALAGGGDLTVTLTDGTGLALAVQRVRAAGAVSVRICTTLDEDGAVDRLVGADVDVIDVAFRGDADTDAVVERRLAELVTARGGGQALQRPWLVPRLHRGRLEPLAQARFFDRWQAELGTAVLDGGDDDGPLIPAPEPASVLRWMAATTLILDAAGYTAYDGTPLAATGDDIGAAWRRWCAGGGAIVNESTRQVSA